MKKMCLLLVLLLLLTGCVNEPTPAVTLQPTVTTSPEETLLPTQTTMPPEATEGENKAIFETTPDGEIVIPDFGIPEYEGELLFPYDPDRDVYILFKDTFDFYPGAYFHTAHGYIMTKKPYAVEDIQLITDMRNEMEVKITDLTEVTWNKDNHANIGHVSSMEMSAYHYISMLGGDWYEIAQATKTGIWAFTAPMEIAEQNGGRIPTDLSNKFREIHASAEQKSWGREYADDFEQYTLPETPGFYYYNIDVHFNQRSYVEETVDNVSVKIGEETYPVDITWRFHTEGDPNYSLKHDWKYITELNQGLILHPIQWNPFNGGYLMAEEGMNFRAQKDIAITGMRCENIDAKVLGCRVYIKSDTGNMDFYWDMQQPLDISEGATVRIDPVFYSQEFEDFYFRYSLHMTMDYEVNNKGYSAVQQFSVDSSLPASWDVYQTVFEGVDIGGYYICFLPAVSTGADWLDYIPESWLQE